MALSMVAMAHGCHTANELAAFRLRQEGTDLACELVVSRPDVVKAGLMIASGIVDAVAHQSIKHVQSADPQWLWAHTGFRPWLVKTNLVLVQIVHAGDAWARALRLDSDLSQRLVSTAGNCRHRLAV